MNFRVIENALIESITARFRRSPRQLNALQESDAELIRLEVGDLILAITTDSLVEEIASGLYDDPRLIGWMTVMVNASDLAAVGAEPLGILLNQTFPEGCDPAWLEALQLGIDEASRASELPVLGGDVNFSYAPQMGGTAIGVVTGGRPLTRIGAKSGDRVFASGPLGAGAAYAFQKLCGASSTNQRPGPASDPGDSAGPDLRDEPDGGSPDEQVIAYRPLPRLREGRLLRGLASCCMDTSDGLIPALHQLALLNGVGFDLGRPTAGFLDPASATVARSAGIPEWMLLAGPHGEFELVFTIPTAGVEALQAAAAAIDWKPVELGAVTAETEVRLEMNGVRMTVDATSLRNLAPTAARNPGEYVSRLAALVSPETGAR